MRFVLISDVHTDQVHWDWTVLDSVDKSIPIVVAGDINNDVWHASYWIAELRIRFPKVIWVAGNHDFYNTGFHQTRVIPGPEWEAKWPSPYWVPEIVDHYRRWSQLKGIHFLHRDSVVLDGVEFVGTTGWHDFVAGAPLSQEAQIAAWKRHMTESHLIKWDLEPGEFEWQRVLEEAQLEARGLQHLVRNTDTPKVVITHHVPHRNFLRVTADPTWNALNGAFCNTLLETVRDPSIRVWCFGHTHHPWDRDLDGIRYLCNPRGYPRENPGWAPREIEVEI